MSQVIGRIRKSGGSERHESKGQSDEMGYPSHDAMFCDAKRWPLVLPLGTLLYSIPLLIIVPFTMKVAIEI